MVSDEYLPHISSLYRFRTIAEFKADIEFFLKRFEPLTLNDVIDVLNGEHRLKRPSFHLTFDDGFREMHDTVAPLLQSAGVPATFFVNTAFIDGQGLAHHNRISLLLDRLESKVSVNGSKVEHIESILRSRNTNLSLRDRILSIPYAEGTLVRCLAEILEVDVDSYIRESQPYLSSGQIAKLLKLGFTIGSHSHDHPLYAELPCAQQLEQTRIGTEVLQARFGIRSKAFAFPHTDEGVGAEFFSRAFAEGLFEVSFGTGGLVPHFWPRNIERVSMEKKMVPAANIVNRQFARATYFRIRRGLSLQH